MLKLLLLISTLLRKESISIQREILNRLGKKRPTLNCSSRELIELYEHANQIVKYRKTTFLTVSDLLFLLKYPKTAMNLLNGKKVPVAEIEKFRKLVGLENT